MLYEQAPTPPLDPYTVDELIDHLRNRQREQGIQRDWALLYDDETDRWLAVGTCPGALYSHGFKDRAEAARVVEALRVPGSDKATDG